MSFLWTHASSALPGDGLPPTDYGLLQPAWLDWPAIPANLFGNGEENQGTAQTSSNEEDAPGIGMAQTWIVSSYR